MGDCYKRSLLLIIEQGEFRRTQLLVWAALERKIRKRNLIFSLLARTQCRKLENLKIDSRVGAARG